jgi:hypothetical protein
LTAIFRDFIKKVSHDQSQLLADVSLVYFDKEQNGYSIDIFFELPIEEVEDEEKLEAMTSVIENVVEQAERHYDDRILA